MKEAIIEVRAQIEGLASSQPDALGDALFDFTQRDISSSFAVITGHERNNSNESATRVPGQAEGRRRWDRIAHAAEADEIRSRLTEGTVDLVTFTSFSTVKNFVAAIAPMSLSESILIACIGPSTAQTARGLLSREPEIVAEEHTVPGLIDALEKFFA